MFWCLFVWCWRAFSPCRSIKCWLSSLIRTRENSWAELGWTIDKISWLDFCRNIFDLRIFWKRTLASEALINSTGFGHMTLDTGPVVSKPNLVGEHIPHSVESAALWSFIFRLCLAAHYPYIDKLKWKLKKEKGLSLSHSFFAPFGSPFARLISLSLSFWYRSGFCFAFNL